MRRLYRDCAMIHTSSRDISRISSGSQSRLPRPMRTCIAEVGCSSPIYNIHHTTRPVELLTRMTRASLSKLPWTNNRDRENLGEVEVRGKVLGKVFVQPRPAPNEVMSHASAVTRTKQNAMAILRAETVSNRGNLFNVFIQYETGRFQ